MPAPGLLRAIRDAADLRGKRVGMYSWTASGSIWYRHFLEWAGVEAGAVQWCIGNIVGRYDARANVYPSKARPEQKIDAAVALIIAIARCMAAQRLLPMRLCTS